MSALLDLQNLIQQARDFAEPAPVAQVAGCFTFDGLVDWCLANQTGEWLVDRLLPRRSLALLAGVSGLGKSPLLYQLALAIATGQQFLGRDTHRGRVLYMDCENSPSQVADIVTRLSDFLGLERAPGDLVYWNRNAVTTRFSYREHLEPLLSAAKPDFVILDPISSIFREAEHDAEEANEMFDFLRSVMAAHNCGFLLVHHLKKNSTKSEEKRAWLETTDNVNEWLENARGSLALINGSDIRLGADWPADQLERLRKEPALVLRGFARFDGELPAIRVSRVKDEVTGRPKGYVAYAPRPAGGSKPAVQAGLRFTRIA